MEKLIQWIKDSERFEFCKSYGVNLPDMELVERQEDFYITMLSVLHEAMLKFLRGEENQQLKKVMLEIAKGLLIYSQKETSNDFHGVRFQNNQLYVASLYYLCDYPAVSAWIMGDIFIEEYEEMTSQMLFFIVTGGRTCANENMTESCRSAKEQIEKYILTGNERILEEQTDIINKKYENRDFESPSDFYMTIVLMCVLRKFASTNIWKSLKRVDSTFDWTTYIHHSYHQHILSFLPSQQDALDKGLIGFKGSFSLKMPTSAGKSYITELLIYHELRTNPEAKVLYLAPLRALSRELKDHFRRIHSQLGFSYATKYGGSTSSVAEEIIADAQLLIATPESFMAIESADDELLDKYTLVICDEGQLLDDYSRGVNYELLLTRLRRQASVRFLFISAIIPNIEVINKWLGGSDEHIGDNTYRPSKLLLTEAIVKDDRIDLNVYDDTYSNEIFSISPFITKNDAQGDELRKKNKNKWSYCGRPVGCTLALKSLKAGSVLLFTTAKTKGLSCTSLTKYLIEMLAHNAFDTPSNYVTDPIQMGKLVDYSSYQLGENHLFCTALKNGFAFHHGDIPQNLREKIECAYDKGVFRLIISNTTLAEGVNLPIKTIILAYANDQSNQGMFLPNTRLKNIIGRVGRAGRERYGTIIVPAIYHNATLIRLVREALDSDDRKLNLTRGVLYDLICYLKGKELLQNENDINQLLSVEKFADAIDEMILRSTEGDLSQLEIENLITDSLAYNLSDEEHKEILKSVFAARHNSLKSSYDDEKFQLMRATGLNARELDCVEHTVLGEDLSFFDSIYRVDDTALISYLIDKIVLLPTVETKIDSALLKIVSEQWMKGYQYWEIAREFNITVDKVVLIVKELQGVIHDKAVSIIAYLREVYGINDSIANFWPEYLRLGINTRLMFSLHLMRIPERIQLHALQSYFDSKNITVEDTEILKDYMIENKDEICEYMLQHQYPVLSIESLAEVIGSFKL